MSLKLALWSAAAGALIPVMAVLNGRLGRAVGEPMHAPVILFLISCVFCSVMALLTTGALPGLASVTKANPIDLFGGFIVAFYVISATLIAPRFGVGNFILYAMVAQIILSALIDHFGFLGMPSRPINLWRLAGLGLLVMGLAMTQFAHAKPSS
jgi:transporter family-2 protein